MNLRTIALLVGVFLGAAPALAHPVSFQGGVGLMSYNSKNMTEILATYSVTSRFALAHTYFRQSDSEFYIPRANLLVKRWNNTDSQGNIYLSAGSGVENYNSNLTSTHLGEAVLDWESREFYVYLSHLYLRRDNTQNIELPSQDFNFTNLRLGFAPFLADYEDLNVWLIVQFQRVNEMNTKTTQFIRFYRKNVLWEVGAGFDGSVAFNFMIHI